MGISPTERKRQDRANKRKAGYVLKQIWVKPESWVKIKAYIKKNNACI